MNDIDFNEHLVAQRYIHRPFLLDGLKFDLRLYLLLAGCNPLRVRPLGSYKPLLSIGGYCRKKQAGTASVPSK